MTLLTAHRILIGTAIAFFTFYGAWELARARAGARPWAAGAVHGGLALLAALVLLVYFRTLACRRGPSGDRRGGDR